tara:strand:- start:1760 stop:2047 length:288 start_codon:yes stop_codon:yes gene_type:complete
MGNIINAQSYESRGVNIPNGSPLFTHICQKEEHEKREKYIEKNFKNATPLSKYDSFITELKNKNYEHNNTSSSMGYLCCKERDGYGVGEFNRINI